ncbi:MAG: Fic family protein [Microbacterium sp.]
MPSDNWPSIAFESRTWTRSGDEIASRRQRRRITGEYLSAVPPDIRRTHVELEPDVLAAADEASHELARFDAELGAFVTPFAAILLRTESASSSEVENLTAGAKQVALAELSASSSTNARLVLANTRAMEAALRLSDQLDEEAVIAMHDALLRESAPHFVGGWRREPVWIGGGALSPHSAEFVPPHQDLVPSLMNDLLDFADRDDVPILVQAAITHAQFETIHPFPDGNGRTGRALIHAMLRRGRLTRNVTVPVSAGLLHDPRSYFQSLTEYRAGDVDAIVHAVTNATFSAIRNGRRLAGDITGVRREWAESVRARSDSAVHRLMDVLLAQPVITAKSAAGVLGVSEVTASAAISRLADAGVLVKASGGARYRTWQAPSIIAALDDFAERARRGRI